MEKTKKQDNNEALEVNIDELNKKIEELQQKNSSLEEDVKTLTNAKMMAQAELINYRKRKDEETSNLLKYCNEDLLQDLLPVMDNFERAINLDDDNSNDSLSKFLSGFKLIYNHMKELLQKYGVNEIECLGKEFDANLETSVFMENNSDYDNDVVLEVLQKGYTYNDKLLRSASVKINKNDEKINNENKEGNDKNE